METVYPTTTGENQIASEKVYPVDYSHFNINGRAFGAMGALLDADRATIYHVGLEREIGTLNPVKLALPIILPALIKLNWPDYFGGAAMAGVNAVIGEGAVSKDPTLAYENGKVVHAPKLREMLDAFNKYDRGYGQIILQANYDDDAQGVPEYAIRECGAKAIEFKFGQSAKGTQPANLVPTLEEALKKCGQGFLVLPDPRDPCVQEAYGRKACPAFHVYGRLPIWSNDYLIGRIAQLRDMGMTNVYFKMAGFDPEDLEHVLRLASKAASGYGHLRRRGRRLRLQPLQDDERMVPPHSRHGKHPLRHPRQAGRGRHGTPGCGDHGRLCDRGSGVQGAGPRRALHLRRGPVPGPAWRRP